MEQDKLLQSQCRNMLKDYEEVLIRIIQEEKKGVEKLPVTAKTEYELVKNFWFAEGIKEGMQRLFAGINKRAQ